MKDGLAKVFTRPENDTLICALFIPSPPRGRTLQMMGWQCVGIDILA